MKYGIPHDDYLAERAARSIPSAQFDGRLPSFIWARVTDIKDPEKQGRIKCRCFWQVEDKQEEWETDWITRVTPFVGPTKMKRERRFGVNWPHPEVGSLAILACMGGDPHDLIFLGQPEYIRDEYGAPPSDKDDHTDWSFRLRLQNGWEWGVDTEGNEYKITPGNYRHKVLASLFISARGIATVFGAATRIIALAMNRLIGAKVETANYKTPEEAAEVRTMAIDAMDAPQGKKDPGIGKVPHIWEGS